MVESEKCPAISDLSELMDGRLVEPQLSSFAAHLENCGSCQAKVKTLAPTDTLQEHLRGDATEVDRIAKATPRNLIDRLKQIPNVDSNGRLAMALLSGDQVYQDGEQEFPFATSIEGSSEKIAQLGRYQILRTLGKGGMGVVFQARDTKLGREVALKVMRPRIASITAAKERFLHEAQSAAKLKNDHIVTIYEVGECDQVPYLAMELLEGQTLEDYLRANSILDIEQVLSFGRDIAIGLREAHAKGLIHRDIKPSNLWVEETASGAPRVKVLDFGLARAEIDDIQMTHTGAIVGTPAFMAPEQARGDKTVDVRADLFSLGCVLYLMATSELPFKADTTMGTLMALAVSQPLSPKELRASVPKQLSELILQLLAKDPALRPSTAQEVLDRIDDIEIQLVKGCLHDQPSQRRHVSKTSTIRHRSFVLALVSLVLFPLLGLLGVLYWQTQDGKIVRIESNDPSIKISVGERELQVTGAYKNPISIAPGKVAIKITKPQEDGEDFEFETDKLIVHRGEKIVLRVELLEGKLQLLHEGRGVVAETLVANGPKDRRLAAEWILATGGKLLIDGGIEVKSPDQLPMGNFDITEANLFSLRSVTDDSLANLARVDEIKRLRLEGTRVGSAGLKYLSKLKGLENLNLYGLKIGDDGLQQLDGLSNLKELCLGGGIPVTDEGLLSIQNCKRLERLFLDGTLITDKSLDFLQRFDSLQELNVAGTMVTESGLMRLGAYKGLTSICLIGTPTTDAVVEVLCSNPLLTTLCIDHTQITDLSLQHLQKLNGLSTVYVRGNNLSIKAIEDFHSAVPNCQIYYDDGVIK